MNPKCAHAATQAAGRDLTEAELRDIEARLGRHMRMNATRAAKEGRSLSRDELITESAKTANQEIKAERAKAKQRLELKQKAALRVQAALAKYDKPLDGLEDIVAFDPHMGGSVLSIEGQAMGIRADMMSRMPTVLQILHGKYLGLKHDAKTTMHFVQELFGEDSGNPVAKKAAEEFKASADTLRDRFNRNGGVIGFLEDWGLPHGHASAAIARAGRDPWMEFVLPRLNRAKYMNEDGSVMNDAEVRLFLHEAWETLATDGANKVVPGKAAGWGARANRHADSRTIHFKDAESYIAYQNRFGDKPLNEVIIGHVSTMAKDIALLETLGPDPNHMFQMFLDQTATDMIKSDPTKRTALEKKARNVHDLYDVVAGRTPPVASVALAKAFGAFRSMKVAGQLGSAVISSFSDEATIQLTAKVNNIPAMQLFKNELKALNPFDRKEKARVQSAGLGLQYHINALSRFGADAFGATSPWQAGLKNLPANLGNKFADIMPKLASAVIRASGLQALTEARQRGFGVTMMATLGKITSEENVKAGVAQADLDLLHSKGVTDADWLVWRLSEGENWGEGNERVLTPASIYRIPDESLRHIGDPKSLKEQAVTHLLGGILEETNMAIIEPMARNKTWLEKQQRGTVWGEIVHTVALYKSFPIAVVANHIGRGLSMPTGGGKAAYVASLIAGMTIMGAVSVQIRDFLDGKDFAPMDSPRFWIKSLLKGGSLGIYGDFLFAEMNQHGGSPMATILGPGAGFVEEVLNLTQGNLIQAAVGKDTHAGAEAVKFAKDNTPGANLWYLKSALNHMIYYRLMEYFSPGYLSRMKRRAKQDFGQTYWWAPEKSLPSRAPRFTD